MAGTIVSDTIQNGAGASTSTTNVVNGVAKAWVNYNGGSQVVASSYGVSSVTYVGTGQYTVNWTTAFTSATSYTVVCGGPISNGRTTGTRAALTSTTAPIGFYDPVASAYNADTGFISVAAFGA